MKILVVGAGAVGSFLGGLLAASGHELTLVRLDAPVLEAAPLTLLRADGSSKTVETRLRPSVPAPGEPGGDPALILLAVKMFTLPEALEACRPWPDVPVLTIQNGVGADELVTTRRGGGASIAASLTAAIEPAPGGAVRQLDRGGIALSPVAGPTLPLARRLAADFRRVGLRAALLPDPVAMKWSKLLANLVGNATSAILDTDPAVIYSRGDLYAIERAQMLETLAVLRALGRRPVGLPGAPIPWLARGFRVPAVLGRPILARIVGGARGGKLPSLRLAVERGEVPTEAAWLNGGVAREAARHALATPVNAALARLVDEVAAEPERRRWFAGRPDRLVAELSADGPIG